MDFQIYDSQENPQVLLLNDSRSKNWNISMDGDEYFNWTNNIKIDGVDEGNKNQRKRKLNQSELEDTKSGSYKQSKASEKSESSKKTSTPQTGTRMPQWQVDDIADLNADIDGSLNGLGNDHSNNSFNMSDAILSLSGMTVFKQEAPSPTNNHEMTVGQFRQNPQQPSTTTTTAQSSVNQINTVTDSSSNAILNSTLHQLLSQNGYNNISNSIDSNLLNSPNNVSQDGYGVTSSNCNFAEDCRFQYVLAAATSIATKINEDTLTYLNQGQSYEIKLKKLGDLSMYRGKLLKSVIKICFHERRLQYMEKEQMATWQQSRPGDRILEIDVPLSYGLYDVIQPTSALNTVQFSWDPTKEVGAYIKVNCISTEFTPKKHGGEKGVPFRIQVETFQAGDAFDSLKHLHAAACQIKVFKLKGADRKHKQDREKILKRPITEQEKYQPSYECTVLNDIPNDSLVPSPPTVRSYSPESASRNNFPEQQTTSDDKNLVAISPVSSTPVTEKSLDEPTIVSNEQLVTTASPQQTVSWLTANRYEKYILTFANFSGADMLRMSRDDLIQICGSADGIRLYNALHSKPISPKLTIYTCRENSTVFNAIFLTTLTNSELVQKLCTSLNIQQEQVRDIYIQGPQSIHILLTNDVIKHIKEETMFKVEILQDDGRLVFLLKPFTK